MLMNPKAHLHVVNGAICSVVYLNSNYQRLPHTIQYVTSKFNTSLDQIHWESI